MQSVGTTLAIIALLAGAAIAVGGFVIQAARLTIGSPQSRETGTDPVLADLRGDFEPTSSAARAGVGIEEMTSVMRNLRVAPDRADEAERD